jgi:hypothetical protein
MSVMKGEIVRLRAGVSIREFKQRLGMLPLSVAHAIAQQAAPLLTRFAQEANAAQRNVYGDPYPEGVDGTQLDLVFTGDTRRTLRFVVSGTIIRCQLGPRYAKYLIGKYKILPIGDRTAMPANWRRALDELARTVVERPTLAAA